MRGVEYPGLLTLDVCWKDMGIILCGLAKVLVL